MPERVHDRVHLQNPYTDPLNPNRKTIKPSRQMGSQKLHRTKTAPCLDSSLATCSLHYEDEEVSNGFAVSGLQNCTLGHLAIVGWETALERRRGDLRVKTMEKMQHVVSHRGL